MSTVTFESADLGSLSSNMHGSAGFRASLTPELRFNAAGFGWKSYQSEENDPVTFNGGDLRSAAWIRVARNFQLRLLMRSADKPRVTFDGFKREDFEKVKRTLDEWFNVKLDSRDISLKGWNWGHAEVLSNDLAFQVDSRLSFEIPLSEIANSNIAGKNEVAIEFNPAPPFKQDPKNLSVRAPDELVEMRFYVPGKSLKKGSENGEANGNGEDEDEEVEVDEDGNEVTAAEALHNLIKDRADIGQVVGDSIVVFEEVLVLTPRGRFSFEIFADSLRLVGKSTDYRLPYTSIRRLFLIPKVDDLHYQLILGLDPPIRQGATRYPFLVAQWPKDEEVDAELNMTEEEMAKFPDLQKKYESPTYSVVSRVLKGLTGKKVVQTGGFKSAQNPNSSGIKANVKATQGELYFLDKGLIFIAKQPILLDFSKTEQVVFSRVGGGVVSARTFDMRVTSKSEGADTIFTSIPKEEATSITAFLQSKGVRVRNEMDDAIAMDVDPLSDESEDDISIPSEDDRKGKGKNKAPAARRGGDDDDEESEDEDFQSESSDGGSPSESDSEDSGGASDASDPMMDEIRKKAPKRPNYKDGSGSEEDKPKKKKPKAKKD